MKPIASRLARALTLGMSGLALIAGMILVAPSAADAGERMERKIRVDGRAREYTVFIPDGASGKEMPVLMAWHPGGATSEWMEENGLFHAKAGGNNFIVVYPNGFRRTFNAEVCCGLAVERGIDDIKFFRAIMSDLATVTPIKPKAYVTGFSNGAMMNYRLVCEVPEMIAAAAPFAGAAPMDNCKSGQVPIMHLNGAEDRVSLNGGERETKSKFGGTSSYLTPPTEALADIASRNGCSSSQSTLRISDIDSNCKSYSSCGNDDVLFCVIPNLGHIWPGAPESTGRLLAKLGDRFGPTRPDLNGTEAIIDFFLAH